MAFFLRLFLCSLPLMALLLGSAVAQAAAPPGLPLQIGHSSDIIDLLFSPDGKRLLSYSAGDESMALWDIASGRVIWRAPTTFVQDEEEFSTIEHFAWGPDQKWIAGASANGKLLLWDAGNGTLRWNVRSGGGRVNCLAFSGDSRTLATVDSPQGKTYRLKLWNTQDGALLRTIPGKFGDVIAIAFCRQDRELVLGSISGEVRRLALPSGRVTASTLVSPELRKMDFRDSHVTHSISYSPDLSRLAAVLRKGTASLFDTERRQLLRTISCYDSLYTTFAFSGNNRKLAISGSDHFFIHDLESGEQVAVTAHSSTQSTICLSQDGALAAEGSPSCFISDTRTGRPIIELSGHPGDITAIAVNPDGKSVTFAGADRSVWVGGVAGEGARPVFCVPESRICSVAFNRAGTQLAVGCMDDTVRIFDANARKPLHRITQRGDSPTVRFGLDDRRLVVWAGLVMQIYDTDGYRPLLNGSGEQRCSMMMPEVGHDGQKLLTCQKNGEVVLWDLATAKPVVAFPAKSCRQAWFSADDTRVLVASREGPATLAELDARTGERLAIHSLATGDFSVVDLSPDRRLALVHDQNCELYLWDWASASSALRLECAFSCGEAFAFTPDGRSLIGEGDQQHLQRWDTVSGKVTWALFPDPEYCRARTEHARKFLAYRQRDLLVREKEDRDIQQFAGNVAVSFLHYGTPINIWEDKFAGKGRPSLSLISKPREQATGAWLRLFNHSPRTVQIFSYDTGAEWKDGMETAFAYVAYDQAGEIIHNVIDCFGTVFVPPGGQVVFSIYLEHILKGRSIRLFYDFVKEDPDGGFQTFGSEQNIRIDERILPAKK